jgi:glutathione S-transferase
MVKLYGFGKNLGLIDPSPFVSKVHTFLRMANIEYDTISNPRNIGKSPKNKLPFIEDGEKAIGDSQLIIDYLVSKHSIDLDAHLSKRDQALAYLLTKSLDENLYWCLVWSRWQHEATWQLTKKAFFKGIPFPLSYVIPNSLRKKVIKTLYAQGISRHSEAEIIAIAKKSFQALSDMLADKAYFFGDKACSFDATAFAFISSFTMAQLDNEINEVAKNFSNLVAYTDRMQVKYYQ